MICRVIDGDTVRVYRPGTGMVTVRLLGFDAPEVFSPRSFSEFVLGIRATWTLRREVRRASQVRLVFGGTDRYGRHLTRLYLDDADVAHRMIGAGLARPYGGGMRASWSG